MSGGDRLWQALRVPETAWVDRRVPKARLIEGAELSLADRRLVEAGVERIDWRATLRPTTTGIPASADPYRPYGEIVVLIATLRSGASGRLPELLHRAVTAPLILIADGDDGGRLSVGLKRTHEREAARLVVDRVATSPPVQAKERLGEDPDPVGATFLASLDLARTPAADLFTYHAAILWRAEALSAAQETGAFRLPRDESEAEARRGALLRLPSARATVARLRREARATKSLARRVALSHEVREAEVALARTLSDLA